MKQNLSCLIFFLILAYSCKKEQNTLGNWNNYLTGAVSFGVQAIAIDSLGNKWFATGNNGVAEFDGNNWMTYKPSQHGLHNDSITAIAIDAQNNKWFGGNGGILKFDGSNWIKYSLDSINYLYDEVYISSIVIDKKNNNIWIGIYGGGAFKYDGTNWTHYDSHYGLMDDYVLSIAIDVQDNIWFGTIEGVCKFDGTNWTSNYMSGIYSIAIDTQGNFWFGTNSGVKEFDGRNWQTFYNSSISYGVIKIAIDTYGNKWCADNGIVAGYPPEKYPQVGFGLTKFDGTNWTNYTPINSGLSNMQVHDISMDKQGNLWFGSGSGLSELIH